MSLTTTKVAAWAASQAKGRLEPFSYDLPPLGPKQVDVRVTHCGVCHSDLSMINNDWGMSAFPIVPGHEVVGIVEAVGPEVQDLRVGDRVGIGWQAGSCGHCEWCRAGEEQLCAQEEPTIAGRYGGWASTIRVDGRFAILLPEAIESHLAGPLMCAGVTVFAPPRHNGVQPGMRVAVIGVGGLGHLAVQFLAKMGCEVTAITSSHDKDDEARRLGASRVLATRQPAEIAGAANSLDFILSTVAADLPWNDFINCLRPKGTLCFVGVAPNEIHAPVFSLIQREKRMVGGRAGSPADIRAMLAFAAQQGIRPQVERFPVAQVNEAMERMRTGKVRYRAVLEL
ncbi:MAG TPA: NAD(P)-dependent alcohol dehydrogenase [Candidatus Xenobia bacterium]|jgi:uncharacterized zinc-type alcohol dehydrogenase-like protein